MLHLYSRLLKTINNRLKAMRSLFKSLEIRYKFLVSFSIVFFLSMLLCSLFIYVFVRNNIETSIESELNNTTQMIFNLVKTSVTVSIKNHLRAVAEKNEEIVRSLYNQALDNRISEAEAKERASELMLCQTIGTSGYIYGVNSNGMVVVHPQPTLIGSNVAHHDFVSRQMRSPQGYLEYEWKNPGETVPRPKALYMVYFEPWDWIISASAYRTEFTKLVNVEDFRKSILSLKFGKTGYSFVIDSRGTAVIHPKLQGINIFDAEELPNKYLEDMMKRKKGKSVYYWKNPDEPKARQKMVMFNYIDEYQWIVASSCYLDEFYSPLDTIRNFIFGVSIAFFLLMLAITFKISSSITNPLRELMGRFDCVREGDFTARMKNDSTGEVGQLVVYFNRFMDRLETYHQSLQNQIQERRIAQEAQRKSQERYFLLMEAAADPIVTYDMKGNVIYINPAFTRVFGWSLEECVGKRMGHYVPEDNWNETKIMINQVISGNAINNVETRRYSKQGHTVDVSISGAITRDRKGNPSGSIIILRDITKSKQLEKQLIHVGDRERRKIGQDLHDDLCPHLIGIAGLATVLKGDLAVQGHAGEGLADKILVLIEDAIGKARSLARGLCPVHLVSHGLQASLEEIADTLGHASGIKFRFDVDKTVVFQDNSVATHLYYIAREAVTNAVKHSDAGRIELCLSRENELIHMCIKDNGRGIKNTGIQHGMGLQIMAYRAKIIDARFDIETGQNGTMVHVYIKNTLSNAQKEEIV
ncbi:cache domain-containing protein [Desulfobacula phenolica]|uniref:histidine kinase n=1 Tax=Desulfobacula phenolica TaxID=90732 RepID=A0A1H2HSI9_9BACT|nr:cache domain-containing protein [Desulfobacula phenolica]SDU34853.1 PAS domain S-box-containing protein [Desulfobacula phenolica]